MWRRQWADAKLHVDRTDTGIYVDRDKLKKQKKQISVKIVKLPTVIKQKDRRKVLKSVPVAG